ncbi:MAG TPA: PEP-CTERM sorting domain-containing protein, partial [Pirellulales bacterium]|nr:PEP-CTERM sorting domain-containing protein [Pirellulales bacterium]
DAGWAANYSNTISPNGTSGTFNNSGTFTRSVGTGMTTINIPFNNSHIVTVQAGALALNGGGTETGSFQVASGATLNFGGTGTTLAAGSSLSGPGTTIVSGTVSVTGSAVTYSGGGTLQVTTMLGGAGVLNGAGTLTATAPLELSAGTMSGTGITNANGGLSIDGYPNFLDTRTLNNGGSATFTGTTAGLLYVYNGATINNSGTFDAGWAANYSNTISPNGTSGTFNNSGTFTRSVGTGMTTINIPFANTGTVDVQAGTLEFDGSLSIGNNSSLKVSGGKLRINVTGAASVGTGATASISGAGTLELASSISALGVASPTADRVAISNTSTAAAGLLISAGNQQVGAISGSGNVQVNAGTSLTADSIIAGALVIGGASGNPTRVTIAASDDNGEPLAEGASSADAGGMALDGIPNLNPTPGLPSFDPASLASASNPYDSIMSSNTPMSGTAALGDSAVPEPSTITLLATAIAGLSALGLRRLNASRC